jgi:membrane associated rhomboid family serine protease
MIPVRDNQLNPRVPVVTYTLIALNILIFLWDRRWHLGGGSIVFADLAMRPKDVVEALSGASTDKFPLATMFTSLFLHANVWHILGNILFLAAFGKSVENALGHYRFVLYYLFWGVAASAAHLFVMPDSSIPTVGASGAIGGVLGCYFLLFPGNKIQLWVLLVFFPIEVVVNAWVLLLTWFIWQVAVPQEGVANWAHVGGFLAGMATVLIMGGRRRVLAGMTREVDYDFY